MNRRFFLIWIFFIKIINNCEQTGINNDIFFVIEQTDKFYSRMIEIEKRQQTQYDNDLFDSCVDKFLKDNCISIDRSHFLK